MMSLSSPVVVDTDGFLIMRAEVRDEIKLGIGHLTKAHDMCTVLREHQNDPLVVGEIVQIENNLAKEIQNLTLSLTRVEGL